MNIIVCVKSVPGPITKVDISEKKDRLKPAARSTYMNETDEYALDEALVLTRQNGGKVTVITVGPASSDDVLYSAVAKGADRAVRVDAPSDDPRITSIALAQAIKKIPFDLILTGLESNDNMAAQVGIATAERLNLPFLFAATKIEMTPDKKAARVTKEIGGGAQVALEVRLPALISTQSGIQKLTYAPAAKLFQARRKGTECLTLAGLGISPQDAQGAGLEYVEVFKPQKRHTAELLTGTPKEMAQRLLTRIKEAS